MKPDTQDVATTRVAHIPGWPKTPLQMLERIEKRWLELEARDVSNHDFRCLMTDVSEFIHEHKGIQDDMLAALMAIAHRGAGRNDVLRSFMEHNSIPYLPTESPSEWMAHVARWAIALAEKTA